MASKAPISDGVYQMAISAAKVLMKAHPGLKARDAMQMTTQLYSEVNAHILRQCTPEEWKALSPEDKAHVCTKIITALLDQSRRDAFLRGETKRLIN